MSASNVPLLRMVLYAREEAAEHGLQDVADQLAEVANSIYSTLPEKDRQLKDIAELMRLLNDGQKHNHS